MARGGPATYAGGMPRFTFALLFTSALLGCGDPAAPAGTPTPDGIVGTWVLTQSALDPGQRIRFAADGSFAIEHPNSPATARDSGTYRIDGQDLILERPAHDNTARTEVRSSFYQYRDRLTLQAYYPQGPHQGVVGTWLSRTVTSAPDSPATVSQDLRTAYDFRGSGDFVLTQTLSSHPAQHSLGTYQTVSNEVYTLRFGQATADSGSTLYLLDQTVLAAAVFQRTTDSAATSASANP